MNTLGINTGTLDGASTAKWIVAAAAIALFGVASSADAQRVQRATAYGDAAATVTLTGNQTVAGRAVGLSQASSALQATSIFSATANASAVSFGNGAVLRSVAAAASADALAFGEALAADVLGESSAWSGSSGAVVPHVVHPGRVNILCNASASAQGIVTRMTPAIGLALGSGFGEATMKLAGEGFQRLDGFAQESGTCVATVRNDYLATIATLGAFRFGTTEGFGGAFIRYQAQSSVWSAATSQSSGTRHVFGFSSGSCGSFGFADFTAKIPGQSTQEASSECYLARPSMVYQAATSGVSESYSVAISPNIRLFAAAQAEASSSSGTPSWATHHRGQAAGAAEVSTAAVGDVAPYGASFSTAGSFGYAYFSANPKGSLYAVCQSSGSAAVAGNPKGAAAAAATATALANPSVSIYGHAQSSALVDGAATGFTNADIAAPGSRTMVVSNEGRLLQVPPENRTMIAEQ